MLAFSASATIRSKVSPYPLQRALPAMYLVGSRNLSGRRSSNAICQPQTLLPLCTSTPHACRSRCPSSLLAGPPLHFPPHPLPPTTQIDNAITSSALLACCPQ